MRSDSSIGSLELADFCTRLVDDGIYSSVSVLCTRDGDRHGASAGGATNASVFDLASLTKPFVATVALWLASRGDLELEGPVFPEHELNHECGPVTLSDLLRHESGAVAWWPLYATMSETASRAECLLDALLTPSLWGHRRGVYSDVGYMTAARWIEVVTGSGLDGVLRDCLRELLPSSFADDAIVASNCVPRQLTPSCSIDTTKEVELAEGLGISIDPLGPPETGQVQDGNARTLDRKYGVLAGHAGLFGTIEGVFALGKLWLEGVAISTSAARPRDAAPVNRQLAQAMSRAVNPEAGRLCGWFRSDGEAVDARSSQAAPSFHHTGFTGGGLWVEPACETVAVMLGNRIDPLSNLSHLRGDFRRLCLTALA